MLSIPSAKTDEEMISLLRELFSVAEIYYAAAGELRHKHGMSSELNEVEGSVSGAASYVAMLTDNTMIVLQNVLRIARDEARKYGVEDLESRYHNLVGDDEVSMAAFAGPAASSVAEEAGADDSAPVEGSTSAQVTSPYGDNG
jgi:hypothetical protein